MERNPQRNETICAGEEREEQIFTSKSNRVEITIMDNKARQGFIYMLRYDSKSRPGLVHTQYMSSKGSLYSE